MAEEYIIDGPSPPGKVGHVIVGRSIGEAPTGRWPDQRRQDVMGRTGGQLLGSGRLVRITR
jgi:hypothetical protein